MDDFDTIQGFRTVTPVLIYGWLRNDAQRLLRYRRCVLLFVKDNGKISMSHGPQID